MRNIRDRTGNCGIEWEIVSGTDRYFAEWNDDKGYGVCLQTQTIKGTDEAYKDDLKLAALAESGSAALQAAVNNDSNSAADIRGYTTMDALAHFPLSKGRIDVGVYNLLNRYYRTVFAQQAAVTNANALLNIPAQGRTFALSYTLDY